MTPDFKVFAAGIDITAQIEDRLLSLVVTDEVGYASDTVEITLDDRDNHIVLPPLGAPLIVFMGYKETFLVPMGVFTADEVAAKGPPERVIIRGKAVNLGGSIKENKSRAWEDVTIEDIVAKIAGEHGLEPKVGQDLKTFEYQHIDQTDESDINFLTRISKDHDAIASVKGGALLFIPKGEGKTASGILMIPRVITKSGEMSYSMRRASRGNFKSVEAYWQDEVAGEKITVTAGEGSPVKMMRHVHTTEAEAVAAAEAKLAELKRADEALSISMPGDATLAAGGPLIALGFRLGVDGLWSAVSARHQIGGGGFVSSIRAEKPNSETG